MKYLVSIMLSSLLVLFSVTGCGKGPTQEAPSPLIGTTEVPVCVWYQPPGADYEVYAEWMAERLVPMKPGDSETLVYLSPVDRSQVQPGSAAYLDVYALDIDGEEVTDTIGVSRAELTQSLMDSMNEDDQWEDHGSEPARQRLLSALSSHKELCVYTSKNPDGPTENQLAAHAKVVDALHP